MSRKRARAQVVAEQIIENHPTETDVTLEDIETMSDPDLYDWLEAWGYSWEGVDGWVDPEDL
jgi:hypothetical protein